MNTNLLTRLWVQAWSLTLVELNNQEIGWLFRPQSHISLLANRRITLIVSRVRLMAGLFAVLTPLWIIIDILTFPREIWQGLMVARLAATAAFAATLLMLRRMESIHDAYKALVLLLAIPTVFYVFSHRHLSGFDLNGLQAAFGTGYAYLPFVMLAGLSIFPLTLIEALALSTPILGAQALAAYLQLDILNWPNFAASMWLLVLIAGVSVIAGLSQLSFMIVLVREAIRDNMTGCFSRHSGEELLELQFILAIRGGMPLTVAFIDLDKFKSVNDKFGHDAGDTVLTTAAEAIRAQLRTGDMLVRWGGEEFVLIMPNTSLENAGIALERVRQAGFGQRPDGTPMTASIGAAERQQDNAESWPALVEVADKRMYTAKQSGRDRMVLADS